MLEIKNLCKTYKSKGNVITKALDNVSIKFPQQGMVFLLGKSGSGKSTLLNLCGGLDTPDSGEIIVKGRSSKTFSGSDFDSYRNTFIGFVFQEYNILNEFSVEDNIALALELQGKSKDKERIHELLKQVELESFAKRKPNTLSGGQKQRIAIARALIKDPEIIMADEPTGALDSNTGKQVLETLKKLSQTKLVIVVSHDREFAEIYGDRIIELKDGRILSDVTKEALEAKTIGNITMIDNHTISIKQGQKLSEEDIRVLNQFITSSASEVLISNHEKDIADYKDMARIGDTSREAFVATDEKNIADKTYTDAESKLIRSRLPLRHATKIGVSSLRLKPIRLIFTILLSVTSFIMLGIVSTMTFYDKESVLVNNLYNSNTEYISVQKAYNATYHTSEDDYSYTEKYSTYLSESDVTRLYNTYGDNTIFYYTFNKPSSTIGTNDDYREQITISNVNSATNSYYSRQILGFASVKEGHSLRERIIAGKYPEKENEIMISSYTFKSIQQFGLRDENNSVLTINAEEDILNKSIYLQNPLSETIQYKVSGVYNVEDLIPEKYKELINNKNSNNLYEWTNELSKGIYSLVLVSDDFYSANKKYYTSNSFVYTDAYINFAEYEDLSCNSITHLEDITAYNLDGSTNLNPAENCVYLSSPLLYNLIYNKIINNRINTDTELYSKFYYIEEDSGIALSDKFYAFFSGRLTTSDGNEETIDEAQQLECWKEVYAFFAENNLLEDFENPWNMQQTDRGLSEKTIIAGFFFDPQYYEAIALSDTLFNQFYYNPYNDSHYTTNYKIDTKASITGAFIHNDKNTVKLNSLVKEYYTAGEDDSTIKINSYITDTLSMVDSFIEILSVVFLWGGIVFAVFSTLLLFNFISVSITNKKKEIGILRAVGARGTDVFKIFFSESFVIVLICFVISIIGSIFICNIINTQMGKGLSDLSLLVFGPKSILLILGISILVSIISTFLPVYAIAKKKPVDSIRAI